MKFTQINNTASGLTRFQVDLAPNESFSAKDIAAALPKPALEYLGHSPVLRDQMYQLRIMPADREHVIAIHLLITEDDRKKMSAAVSNAGYQDDPPTVDRSTIQTSKTARQPGYHPFGYNQQFTNSNPQQSSGFLQLQKVEAKPETINNEKAIITHNYGHTVNPDTQKVSPACYQGTTASLFVNDEDGKKSAMLWSQVDPETIEHAFNTNGQSPNGEDVLKAEQPKHLMVHGHGREVPKHSALDPELLVSSDCKLGFSVPSDHGSAYLYEVGRENYAKNITEKFPFFCIHTNIDDTHVIMSRAPKASILKATEAASLWKTMTGTSILPGAVHNLILTKFSDKPSYEHTDPLDIATSRSNTDYSGILKLTNIEKAPHDKSVAVLSLSKNSGLTLQDVVNHLRDTGRLPLYQTVLAETCRSKRASPDKHWEFMNENLPQGAPLFWASSLNDSPNHNEVTDNDKKQRYIDEFGDLAE